MLSKSWSLSRTRCLKKNTLSYLSLSQLSLDGSQSYFSLAYCWGLSDLLGCLKLLTVFWLSEMCSDSSREVWLVSDSKCEITDHIWNLISPTSGPKSVLGVFWSTLGITLGEPNICYSHRQPSGEAIRWLDRTQFSLSIQKGQHSEQHRQGKASLQTT